uniref:cytochrome c heme attachment protein n=1 Tax=Carex microglochin TaxID=234725 RepID=UPI001F1420CF|nr:cytochrome c heme attachment protein [Carex microglochin]UKU08478.1 cytochrome c heme attachment protein [Carex microglochin]UZA62126.1 cytochrome c heme attachment protein [Carex littledalei]
MIFLNIEHILTHISFSIISIVIIINLITLLFGEIVELRNSLEKGMIIIFLSTTELLIFRWIYSGYFPLSNLYESLIFLSCSFCVIHMVPKTQNHQNELNTITTPSTILTQGFATSGFCLSAEMHKSTILAPALQSQWLMMHVSMMLLSYGALLCGSLLSVALLTLTCQKKINFEKLRHSVPNYYKYELIERLDYWSYRVISFGFILLTLGILCGAVWANEAWGSYWNWDPKETWAFITWIIFAIYLHIRMNQNCKGKNSAFIASIGFLIIWISYFGINLLGIGLHSYGSFRFI